MIRIVFFPVLFLLSSCYSFFPKTHKEILFPVGSPINQEKGIFVLQDNYGIPYIQGGNVLEAYFALGYLHARDRMFQLDLLRHYSQGRLSEFFGRDLIKVDQMKRLLTYGLQEQEAYLSEGERKLIQSYINGINSFADGSYQTSEHYLLKKHFKPFSIKDVLTIARLQAWSLAGDFHAEIARANIQNLPDDLPWVKGLLLPIPSKNYQVIPSKKSVEEGLNQVVVREANNINIGDNTEIHDAQGSNAWAVSGKLAQEGHALLFNDPHLRHDFPSQFYLASLSAPDFFVAGASFVGLPAILIGSSNNLSWAVTAALVNTQDSVILKLHSEDETKYQVGENYEAFQEWEEEFCTGKGQCQRKTYLASKFGVVLPSELFPTPKGQKLALRWTGHLVEEHKDISKQFLQLAMAKDVSEGLKVVANMTLPGVNMLLADTKGQIGYGYAGIILDRNNKDQENPFIPIDGSSEINLPVKLVAKESKPQVMNPSSGFLVNANQNIFAKLDAKNENFYGFLGAPYYRAARIRENIFSLKEQGPLKAKDLENIQMDSVSLEARKIAPLLGKVCETHIACEGVKEKKFVEAIKNFNGDFCLDSKGALPYHILLETILNERYHSISRGKFSVKNISHIKFYIKQSLYEKLKGKSPSLFANMTLENEQYWQKICLKAFDIVHKDFAHRSSGYLWGKHHYLKRSSPLSNIPILGRFYSDKKRPVAGYPSAPMAETGLPVNYGAVLRMSVKMSSPPEIRMVLDSGNSGIMTSEHVLDQALLWHENKKIRFFNSFEEASKSLKQGFLIDKNLSISGSKPLHSWRG